MQNFKLFVNNIIYQYNIKIDVFIKTDTEIKYKYILANKIIMCDTYFS